MKRVVRCRSDDNSIVIIIALFGSQASVMAGIIIRARINTIELNIQSFGITCRIGSEIRNLQLTILCGGITSSGTIANGKGDGSTCGKRIITGETWSDREQSTVAIMPTGKDHRGLALISDDNILAGCRPRLNGAKAE